jgi:hypothetical protein
MKPLLLAAPDQEQDDGREAAGVWGGIQGAGGPCGRQGGPDDGLARSSWYYEPPGESPDNLALMREIDRLYIKRPSFGTRKVRERFGINRNRAQRLMRLMGLEAICPTRSTSRPAPGHKAYPYFLRNMAITKPDQA